MKAKLIKLQDKFILVSDEEIKEGDFLLINNEDVMQMKSSYDNDVSGEDIWVGDSLNGYATYKDNCKKIIAGIEELPSIDFSLLSEEDCKIIGFVDVERLAKEAIQSKTNKIPIPTSYWMREVDMYERLWYEGFKTAQSLNDKMFGVKEVVELCKILISNPFEKCGKTYQELTDSYIQSLQQTWDVGVEMKRETLYSEDGLDYQGDLIPKITNNSIKIIKIL